MIKVKILNMKSFLKVESSKSMRRQDNGRISRWEADGYQWPHRYSA